jgi:hypothetical protein
MLPDGRTLEKVLPDGRISAKKRPTKVFLGLKQILGCKTTVFAKNGILKYAKVIVKEIFYTD